MRAYFVIIGTVCLQLVTCVLVLFCAVCYHTQRQLHPSLGDIQGPAIHLHKPSDYCGLDARQHRRPAGS